MFLLSVADNYSNVLINYYKLFYFIYLNRHKQYHVCIYSYITLSQLVHKLLYQSTLFGNEYWRSNFSTIPSWNKNKLLSVFLMNAAILPKPLSEITRTGHADSANWSIIARRKPAQAAFPVLRSTWVIGPFISSVLPGKYFAPSACMSEESEEKKILSYSDELNFIRNLTRLWNWSIELKISESVEPPKRTCKRHEIFIKQNGYHVFTRQSYIPYENEIMRHNYIIRGKRINETKVYQYL